MLADRPSKEIETAETIVFPNSDMQPVIDPVDPELLLTDVEGLPVSQMLLESGDMQVYQRLQKTTSPSYSGNWSTPGNNIQGNR